MSAAQPTFISEPGIATIRVRELCEIATNGAGKKAAAEALMALGAISNMYCLYSLSHPGVTRLDLRGLASPPAAAKEAILGEIRKAVPGTSAAKAQSLLEALSSSLQTIFKSKNAPRLRLIGFGSFELINAEESRYTLTPELPLSRFLPTDPGRQNRGAATGF